jgi:2'-5' RNA ligase
VRRRAEERPDTLRAFLALPLDAAARSRVAELVAGLRERLSGLRWTGEQGLHLTLRFLGEARRETLQAMLPALQEAAGRCPRADAALAGLGVFPERGNPRVLWLGVALPGQVLALQEACERVALSVGFPREPRPFRPHLTLARWREPGRRPDLPEPDLGRTLLDHLVLFRSELGPQGARHTALETWPLGA